MRNRNGRVVQFLMMLVLLPAIAVAQALQRSPSDRETGPRGVACNDAAAALRRGTFDLRVGRVTLRDGKACVSPGLDRSKCEWDVALRRVELWGSDGPLLAIVGATHDGPGAWDSVFFYACRQGVLEQIHARRYLYGAKISEGPDSGLVIASGEWRREDPACCASRERREFFAWDVASGKVVLRRTEIRELAKR